jgi:putative flippase GtrA
VPATLVRAAAPVVPAPVAAPLVSPLVSAAAGRQLASFLVVGALTTGVYLALYALAAPFLGAQLANLVALLVTGDLNTMANGRVSFGVHGSGTVLRRHVQGLLAFGVTLVLTSTAIAVLGAAGTTGGTTYLLVLGAANVVGGAVHFLLLKRWVFLR